MPATMKVALIPNDFSQDFGKVCALCRQENVRYVELASMWEKSILNLTEEEREKVHALMEEHGLQAASIQTQIMKVRPPGTRRARPGSRAIHDDFDYNIALIDIAIARAQEFGARYIVTYSFMDKKETQADGTWTANWDKMLQVYAGFLPKLQVADKTVVVECDGGQYMGTVAEHLRLMDHFDSPHIKVNLDLANLHGAQSVVTRADFDALRPHVPYFHVKDRRIRTGFKKFLFGGSGPAVFGEGNIPWRQVLGWCAETGFDGFLSVEPHVHGKDRFELGRQCVQNLQKVLGNLGIPFE